MSLNLIYYNYVYLGILLLLINISGIIIIFGIIFLIYNIKTTLTKRSLLYLPLLWFCNSECNVWEYNKLTNEDLNIMIYNNFYIYHIILFLLFFLFGLLQFFTL